MCKCFCVSHFVSIHLKTSYQEESKHPQATENVDYTEYNPLNQWRIQYIKPIECKVAKDMIIIECK